MEAAMETAHWPGPDLPAAPRFSIDVPDGYVAHPAPGILAMVEPVTRQVPFQPNLTVTADLVPADADPALVLDAIVAETVAAHPGTEAGAREAVTVPGTGDIGDLRATSQHLRIAAPQGTVEQVLAVYVVPVRLPGGITYAFTVASTWLAEEHSDVLRRIHESFRIGGFIEPAS
jgi:hypothetical protein